MLSRRTIVRPATGDFQIAVRTVLPFHVTSRGRPTFTESNRGICASPKSRVWLEFSPISVHWASFCVANFKRAPWRCLTATNDEQERHHPREGSLRSHDLPVPGKERHRRYPLPSPFSWSAATSSRWDRCGALVYPQRRGPRH